MNSSNFVAIHNGEAIPHARIPQLPFAEFRDAIIQATAAGCRISALFGNAPQDALFRTSDQRHANDNRVLNSSSDAHQPAVPGDAAHQRANDNPIRNPTSTRTKPGCAGPAVPVYVVLADAAHSLLRVAATQIEGDHFRSLTPECPQAQLFEREIAEQYGLRPDGHPWLKPVRFHSSYRPGIDAWDRPLGKPPCVGVTDYYRVEGPEIHEVAVGPVHAGVIEPGHFRFQCHGEHVFHLEISLGYQHRGAERTLVGGPNKRTIHTIETVAGDTSIGHGLAYCQAVEALSGCEVSHRTDAIRGIALELERLANHTGDLGALAGDVGFLPTASYCGRLRGDFLNLSALICGNRFGRSLLRPGGVRFDLDETRRQQCLERLAAALRDVKNAAELLFNSASVQARFEDVGVLSQERCQVLGLVGLAARACGVDDDIRHNFPTGIFRSQSVPISTWKTGDVFARAYVRWFEIQRSVAFIQRILSEPLNGPLRTEVGPMKPDHLAVSLVEGWRGEICHVALTSEDGCFSRYKIVDPSFHNWIGLAMALRDQQISDFPLCNKSFNLSYCGHDL